MLQLSRRCNELCTKEMATRYRVLTVGDGDFSGSLAISRCYETQVEITASTFYDTETCVRGAYDTAERNMEELKARNVEIAYRVDACMLAQIFQNRQFDLVVFQFPHLGDRADEMALLQSHCSLVSHYLHSAQAISSFVHIAVKSTQATSWRLWEAAQRANLVLKRQVPVQQPFHHIFGDGSWQSLPATHKLSRVSRRHGKSRHFLGRYGYRHVRTTPPSHKPSDLSGATHYVFEKGNSNVRCCENDAVLDPLTCRICRQSFADEQQLEVHIQAPAIPLAGTALNDPKQRTNKIEVDSSNTTSPELKVVKKPIADDVVHRDMVRLSEDGVRLRWYLQHCNDLPTLSKRQWVRQIKNGHVQVNGTTVEDDSRILRKGWEVSVACLDHINSTPVIDVVDQWQLQGDILFVIWKPVGMRSIGNFDQTLEDAFTRQQNDQMQYKCATKLDTGCSGLCVVSPGDKLLPQISVTFSALVHGIVPNKWKEGVSVQLPEARRWKKRQTVSTCQARLCCIEQATLSTRVGEDESQPFSIVALSTVTLETASGVSGPCQAISYYLRKSGHGVVGDRFNTQEYLTLPRAVRNRIKQKLCIGCTRVELKNDGRPQASNHAVPEKWRASYWQSFCISSMPK